jgi:hypothetical protein
MNTDYTDNVEDIKDIEANGSNQTCGVTKTYSWPPKK